MEVVPDLSRKSRGVECRMTCLLQVEKVLPSRRKRGSMDRSRTPSVESIASPVRGVNLPNRVCFCISHDDDPGRRVWRFPPLSRHFQKYVRYCSITLRVSSRRSAGHHRPTPPRGIIRMLSRRLGQHHYLQVLKSQITTPTARCNG